MKTSLVIGLTIAALLVAVVAAVASGYDAVKMYFEKSYFTYGGHAFPGQGDYSPRKVVEAENMA